MLPPDRKTCLVFPMSCKTSMVISDSYSRENMGAREEHVYMYITQLCSLLLIV